jgi:predicted O-methyltransferase YrrM
VLGTCRSFVDGNFEGCNSDDPIYWNSKDFSKWDWGAGCFSLIFGQLTDCKLTTLDLMESHIKRCKVMTDSLEINCNHVVSNSISFLETTNEKWDLIYLDTGDMWPIDSTCSLQLREAQIIVERDLLKEGGILLIDDVLNGTPREMGDLNNSLGKSETSIPYLLNNGYETVYEGYQYILIKKQ